MGSSILSIAQSGLAAAQAGINTAGHNIANSKTPGYSRQLVTQSTATAQNYGYGFVGQGTEISSVKRIYSDYLGSQVSSAQSSSSGLSTYYNQIKQIDNMLGDSSTGLSPAIQDFFKGINDLAANPSLVSARQAALSGGGALASSFQSMDVRFDEIRQGVNQQIAGTVDTINSYAKQIAELNATISKLQGATGDNVPNDLYDQRDQLVQDLSKEAAVSVVKQDGGNYSIYIGNGQALVAGVQSYSLAATPKAPPNQQDMGVSYQLGTNTVALAESSLNGGNLGGLLDFRSQILNKAQNALGALAQSIATTFNAQHVLGQDLNGAAGGVFFNFDINLGAKSFSVAITDTSKIAAAAPVLTQAGSSNTGSGKISAGVVSNPPAIVPPTIPNVTLTYVASLPPSFTVSSPAGAPNIPYSAGQPIAMGDVSFTITGTPIAGDTFTVGPNPGAVGDSRNALLLAGLQTSNTSIAGTTTYQGAYSQLVSLVGNKTREVQVTGASETQRLSLVVQSQQSVSGVNLNEEASNLLRYQQAFQAAGKVMQIASTMFDVLLSLGR
ncbi:MAG: flagellar hook-associated protein FlgK [Glaciimonas sp.]|nr:flagellar hook-associated protein FlgK [Glaciimonas sp.]